MPRTPTNISPSLETVCTGIGIRHLDTSISQRPGKPALSFRWACHKTKYTSKNTSKQQSTQLYDSGQEIHYNLSRQNYGLHDVITAMYVVYRIQCRQGYNSTTIYGYGTAPLLRRVEKLKAVGHSCGRTLGSSGKNEGENFFLAST